MKKIIIILFIFLVALQAEARLKVDNSDSYVVSQVLAADSLAFLGAMDGSIRVIDPNSSKLLATLKCGSKDIFSISLDRRAEKLIAAAKSGEITLWDIKNIKSGKATLLKRILKPGSPIKMVKLSPDGKKFYIAYSSAIYEFDSTTFHNENIFDGFKSPIFSIEVEKSLVASGTAKGEVRLLLEGEEIYNKADFSNIVSSLSFSNRGSRLLACSYDKTAKLYEASNGEVKVLSSFSFFDSAVTSCSISEDGTMALFSLEEGEAILYDIKADSFQPLTESLNGKLQDRRSSKKELQIISSSISKDKSYLLFSSGRAFEEEHYATLYFIKSKKERTFYLYLSSTLAVSDKGKIMGEGDFMNKITYYQNGNKLSKQEIYRKLVDVEGFRVDR